MPHTAPLTQHHGAWAGTNRFRLMPTDEPFAAPFTCEVRPGAAGAVAVIEYIWRHADDGEQHGLLVLGAGDPPSVASAFWADSWHQPAARALTGTLGAGTVRLDYTYAGDWRWIITVDASDPDTLRLRMDNEIPPAVAAEHGTPPGAYWAMDAELHRAPSQV